MRIPLLVLTTAAVITLGCRSSEEAGSAAATPPAPEKTAKAEDGQRDVRDRYDEKALGDVNRQDARNDAARERDRRIDEDPVEHTPEPPEEETPPR